MTPQVAQIRRSSRIAFAALALASAVACSEDPLEVEEEEEPEVTQIVVMADGSSATVSTDGRTAQQGTLVLRRGQLNTIGFSFRREDSTEDSVIAANRDEFELRPSALLPTSLTFTAGENGALATYVAHITPAIAGQVTIPFVLFNTHHGHAEISAFVVASVVP